MELAAWRIQSSIDAVNMSIAGLNSSIQNYENRRTNLQNIKEKHQERIGNLQNSYNKVNNSVHLLPIKRADIFEGEMEISLTILVEDEFTTVLNALNRGKEVGVAIDAQVSTINTKIATLEAQKGNLSTNLTNLRNDLFHARRNG